MLKCLNGPITRVRVRELLKNWQEPLLLLSKVTGISGDVVSVEQLLEYVTYEFRKNPGMNLRVGSYIFGFALPDSRKSDRGIEFISGFDYVWNEDGQSRDRGIGESERFIEQPRVLSEDIESESIDEAMYIWSLI